MPKAVSAELLDSEPSIKESEEPGCDSTAAVSGVQRCAAPLPEPLILEGEALGEQAIAEALNMAARSGRWDLFEQLMLLTGDDLRRRG